MQNLQIVKEQANMNFQRLLDRGKALMEIKSDADALCDTSVSFSQGSAKLKHKMRRRSMMVQLVIGALVFAAVMVMVILIKA